MAHWKRAQRFQQVQVRLYHLLGRYFTSGQPISQPHRRNLARYRHAKKLFRKRSPELHRLLEDFGDILTCTLDRTGGSRRQIDLPVFHEHLYAPRRLEDEIDVRDAVSQSDSLLLLVAPRGAGKSTLVRNEIHRIGRNGAEARRIVTYDCKLEGARFLNLPYDRLAQLRRITGNIKKHIVAECLDGDAERRQLLLELIKAGGETGQEMREEVRIFLDDPDLTDEECHARFLGIPKLAKQFRHVRDQASCADVIRAIKKIRGYEKFLLFIDNADRIPFEHHAKILSFALDECTAGRGEFGVIAAFRNKSLMRWESSGAGGDIIRSVRIDGEAGVYQKEPRTVSVPTPELLTLIQNNRIAYAKREFGSREGAVQFFAAIDVFFGRLRAVVEESALIRLANHDIRDANAICSNFIKFLCGKIQEGAITLGADRPNIDEQMCRSLFYDCLYVAECSGGGSPFDMEEYICCEHEQPKEATRALAPLFLLHWLHSCRNRRITAGKVYTEAKSLTGLGSSTVREMLFGMYRKNAPSLRLIELGKSEKAVEEEGIRATTRVYITSRCVELLGGTITKFEFFRQSIEPHWSEGVERGGLNKVAAFTKQSLEAVLAGFSALCSVLARAHNDMRDRQSRSHANWRQYFVKKLSSGGDHLPVRMSFSHQSHFDAAGAQDTSWIRKRYRSIIVRYEEEVGMAVGSAHPPTHFPPVTGRGNVGGPLP